MRVKTDAVGGLFLLAVGVLFLVLSMRYEAGTVFQMGPGYLPRVLGGALIVVSLFLIAASLPQPASMMVARWRPMFAVSLAVLSFGLAIRPLGLIPAIVSAFFLASLAHDGVKPIPIILAAGLLAIAAWALFAVLLGMPVPAFGRF